MLSNAAHASLPQVKLRTQVRAVRGRRTQKAGGWKVQLGARKQGGDERMMIVNGDEDDAERTAHFVCICIYHDEVSLEQGTR